jgi:amino acid transporter
LVVPSSDPDLLSKSGAARSPFVIAAHNAGIKVVPSIINAVVLTSAWSSGNSSLLNGSRILYGLANMGRAPKIFTRISRFGVPYVAVCFFALFISLGYMTLSSSASTVFSWLQDLVAISTLVNWITILTVYLRFYYGCKAQGIDRKTQLPWAAPFQPYISWFSLVLFTVLILTGGYSTFIKGHWSDETFVSSYLNIPLFFVVYFGYKLVKKTKIIPLTEIPIKNFIAIYQAHPEPLP